MLAIFAFVTKKKMRYPKKDHLLFAGQGVFMFSVNYMLFYISETMVSSGMTAVAFTSLVYYNMLGMWIFFKKPITKNVIIGSLIGGVGILFLFLDEITNLTGGQKTILGLLISFIATLSASCGNLLSQVTYKKGIPIVVTNTFGMFYGSVFTLLVALLFRQDLAIPMTSQFLLSLLYLSLFGSVIAFGAYLTLAGRIGAEKAAYTSVLSPVIALTLSSFYENFKWTPYIGVGVLLCLLGNILTLKKPSAKKA